MISITPANSNPKNICGAFIGCSQLLAYHKLHNKSLKLILQSFYKRAKLLGHNGPIVAVILNLNWEKVAIII